MNAYLLLSGILTGIGLYTIWTRRTDEGGNYGLHLIVAAILILLVAAGRYLTTFAHVQQIAALVIGVVGLLIFWRMRASAGRRAPFGFTASSSMVLGVVILSLLLYAAQMEMSLYDGIPLVSVLLALAVSSLILIQYQASRRREQAHRNREQEDGRSL